MTQQAAKPSAPMRTPLGTVTERRYPAEPSAAGDARRSLHELLGPDLADPASPQRQAPDERARHERGSLRAQGTARA